MKKIFKVTASLILSTLLAACASMKSNLREVASENPKAFQTRFVDKGGFEWSSFLGYFHVAKIDSICKSVGGQVPTEKDFSRMWNSFEQNPDTPEIRMNDIGVLTEAGSNQFNATFVDLPSGPFMISNEFDANPYRAEFIAFSADGPHLTDDIGSYATSKNGLHDRAVLCIRKRNK